ncbi:MAG: GntR family transcriptional regulator [Sciscionella sp.]
MRPITSKYEQIADELREQVIDGTLAPGSRLPTLAELMEQYGVSERTAFQAAQVLLNEGLITSKPGSRYQVRERPAIKRMVRTWYREPVGGSPWRADMAAQGRVGSWIAQSRSLPAPPAIAERLRINTGERVMRTSYVFTADGEPTYLSTSWEPMALTIGTEIMLPEDGEYAGKGVVDRFAAIGLTINRAVEETLPRNLTSAEAQKLKLRPGTPVQLIERTYFADDQPVETADILIPTHLRPVYEIPVG